MNSEKVKEIKKALECCKQNEIENTCEYCSKCPASDWDYETECNVELFQKTLTLINELESENERLILENEVLINNKVAENIKEQEGIRVKIDIIKTLKDRIAELEKENVKLLDSVETVQGNRCVYKCVLTKQHLTKFAERLMNYDEFLLHADEQGRLFYVDFTAWLDKTLKEILCEK